MVVCSGIFPLTAGSYDLGIQCLFADWVFLPLSDLSLYFHMFWLWALKALGLALVKVVCSVWIRASRLSCQHTQYRPITHSARPFRGRTQRGLWLFKNRNVKQKCAKEANLYSIILSVWLSGHQFTRMRLGMNVDLFFLPSLSIHLSPFSNILFLSK